MQNNIKRLFFQNIILCRRNFKNILNLLSIALRGTDNYYDTTVIYYEVIDLQVKRS